MSAESDLVGYTAANSIVRNFANEMSKEETGDYLKDQNKLVTGLTKDLESAVKDEEKAKKEIKEAEAKIKKNLSLLMITRKQKRN